MEKAESALMEPYYRFKIESHIDYMGKILSDIQKLKGTFEAPQTFVDKVVITGRGPVAIFMNYSMEFTALTKGKGKINFLFDGYDACHNEEEIIKKINYDKNADIDYTSTSIFCLKGQDFLVDAEKAEQYMHCL